MQFRLVKSLLFAYDHGKITEHELSGILELFVRFSPNNTLLEIEPEDQDTEEKSIGSN